MSNSYLETRCQKAIDALDSKLHRAFARAVKDSLTVDLDVAARQSRFPKVVRADGIEQRYSFKRHDQRSYHICLLKAEAYKFLSHYTILSKHTFNKRFTKPAYVEKYSVDPLCLNETSNRMLLTYAEWLHFADITVQPDLPMSISDILGAGK